MLAPYAKKWKLDFASFRPIEEKGRQARVHARNDLSHFDSFPTRPTTGIENPAVFHEYQSDAKPSVDPTRDFDAFRAALPKCSGLPRREPNPLMRGTELRKKLHLPGAKRSPYDDLMHRCHNAMKEDGEFQENTPKNAGNFRRIRRGWCLRIV